MSQRAYFQSAILNEKQLKPKREDQVFNDNQHYIY